MRFPSPLFRSRRPHGVFALFALALAMFALGGACEDKHVGRPCELGTMPMGGTSGRSRRSRRPRWSARAASACCPAPRIALTAQIGHGRHRPALHRQLRVQRGLRGRRDRAKPTTQPTSAASNGFACIWPTTVGNFALPALLRLPRLLLRAAGRREASRPSVAASSVLTAAPTARAPRFY